MRVPDSKCARQRSGRRRTAAFELLNGAGRFAAIGQQVPKVQARSGEAGLQANWPLAWISTTPIDLRF
jgi:hypothetical protein